MLASMMWDYSGLQIYEQLFQRHGFRFITLSVNSSQAKERSKKKKNHLSDFVADLVKPDAYC